MDISSRKERELAEARLREERDAMLRLAVESSPSGMVMCRADDSGQIVLVNASAEKVRCTYLVLLQDSEWPLCHTCTNINCTSPIRQ